MGIYRIVGLIVDVQLLNRVNRIFSRLYFAFIVFVFPMSVTFFDGTQLDDEFCTEFKFDTK